jgi:hypothetical protein
LILRCSADWVGSRRSPGLPLSCSEDMLKLAIQDFESDSLGVTMLVICLAGVEGQRHTV